MSHIYKRFLLVVILLVLVTFYLSSFPSQSSDHNHRLVPKEIYCNLHRNYETLPDILDEAILKEKLIFFHETTCQSYSKKKIYITARQACAVESAARQNSNFKIHLLFTSTGIVKLENTETSRILRVLLSYDNVKLNYVNLKNYTTGTPLENLFESGRIERSFFLYTHISDVLRYLTLWKYGGIYLDLDVIVAKNLGDLGANFAGLESTDDVAAGILGFSPTGPGHDLAGQCLEDLNRSFKGDDWGYNGPGVITRLLKRICGTESAEEMPGKNCSGFLVFQKDLFYPVPWSNWTMYFSKEHTKKVLDLSRNSYVIHGRRLLKSENVAYILFARKFCPKVFQECDKYF